jgi:hypothetical protein
MDGEFSQFLYQSKQAKIQWLQDPKQSNVDTLNNARHEASKQFSMKRKGTRTRTNIVKDKKGDLVTQSHSIMAMHRNNLSQLLNVHVVNDIG